MTANETVHRLILSINGDDKSSFYRIADQYLASLSVTGDTYARIKSAINQKPKSMMLLSEISREMKSLLSPIEVSDENVFMPAMVEKFVSDIVTEWSHSEAYKFHNINVRNKILLHGPTGNGKTTIARHFARLSNLPYIEIKSDFIIDSHLGKTAANINKIFSSITEPCVLFWDEIDSIGRRRGDSENGAAGMENERMINSMLVNMERLHADVIFIGATNRKNILDSAFLRRFDEVFEISSPTLRQKQEYADSLVAYYNLPREFNMPLDKVADLESYSAIKLLVVSKVRQYILEGILAKNEAMYA
ncbi:AAA family ATPase [Dyadobacter sandarakinus]|uniref:ATP-binding protein n=1 Tax=Dyadobacter sandarakinus TaxID=2747268 RepID=A0ABX7I2G6_9BACT|nr:ATP-binding protein [Dyadobacter sandarakinus]QRQ99736.1 ATP-binding protein [Dyadobacter sandarakinus]